jgi:hypothetical protein
MGLLDAHDHRVGAGKRLGVGVAKADVGHPGAAVGGGVSKPAGVSMSMFRLISRPNVLVLRSSSMMAS